MKPRKKWEPQYRFGGNPSDYYTPNPLGENAAHWRSEIKVRKPKRKKK